MEGFGTIVDPETNTNVLVQSAVGQQVIKNYLECLKNGPDSQNILSTKMFYKRKPTQQPKSRNQKLNHNSSSNNKYSFYEKAKKLTSKQFNYDYLKQRDFCKNNSMNQPVINDIIWIKRSNGKWQLSNVINVKNNELEVYFNNGEGKIGTKKGLKSRDILHVSNKVKNQFS